MVPKSTYSSADLERITQRYIRDIRRARWRRTLEGWAVAVALCSLVALFGFLYLGLGH